MTVRTSVFRSPGALAAPAALLLALALSSGCDCSGDVGTACDTDADCGAGRACVADRCVSQALDGGAGRDGQAERSDAAATDSATADAGPCRAVSAESTIEPIPVDIIIAIDNSGSMTEEAVQVQANINVFAEIIAMSGLDYRVVLINDPDDPQGVCVPPPLGSGEPTCLSGPEGRLLAIHEGVASNDALEVVLAQYDVYRDFLRPEAAKVFLWITDDESDLGGDDFRTQLAALAPAGMFDRTIHNAIVGYYGDTAWSDRSAGTCDSLADVGEQYLQLATCVDRLGAPIADCIPGSIARVCETDWRPIFEDIAMGVVAGVPVVCEFDIPEPPEGSMIDLDAIRVTYRSADVVRAMLGRVSDLAACTGEGWYFDDPVAPTQMVLCPDVCRDVQADPDASLDIALGCFADLM